MRHFVLLLALMAVACGRYNEWDSLFMAYNNSNDPVMAIVEAVERAQISPQYSGQFTVHVLVPTRRVDTYGGPSSIDRSTMVTVAFRNLRTGETTDPPVPCQAGAKVKTTIWYSTRFGDRGHANCMSAESFYAANDEPKERSGGGLR